MKISYIFIHGAVEGVTTFAIAPFRNRKERRNGTMKTHFLGLHSRGGMVAMVGELNRTRSGMIDSGGSTFATGAEIDQDAGSAVD